MVDFHETEMDISVRELEFPDNLRPDLSQLPQGEELVDMLEDINRQRHGLEPLHGAPPIYYVDFGIYSRETLLERDEKVFTPHSSH